MTNFTVIYDACVLYPAPLRDFLMWLAVTDLFKARWTDDIHDEWIRNVLKNRPDLSLEQLTKTKDFMNAHVRDCLVTGYQGLVSGLSLPDQGDIHVLAAAIRCNADVILTFNLKDLPDNCLATYGIEAQHPDEFVRHLIDLNLEIVCQVAAQHRNSLKKPAKTQNEYLATLFNQGLPQTYNELSKYSYKL